ncbi:MAG: hypothetical protein Q4C45_06040 [Oscillospiraceae bacterium]|nr:hypothetical protein [Oscillospiraceae bacterium]
MRFRLAALLSCLLLLAGCSGQAAASRLPQPKAESAGEAVAVLSLPPGELEPYEPPESMEPDRVSADTMGEILCDKTLPDGTEIVCYWHPDYLTDPEYQYTKYWAVRRGDELLRFCREDSAYSSSEDYDVTAFSGVLGQDGFRIKAHRGAAYLAYDYYVVDGDGVPRLLADCANTVLEGDFNSDGVTELLWFYHGGREAYYYALLNGQVCFADVTSAFSAMVDSSAGESLLSGAPYAAPDVSAEPETYALEWWPLMPELWDGGPLTLPGGDGNGTPQSLNGVYTGADTLDLLFDSLGQGLFPALEITYDPEVRELTLLCRNVPLSCRPAGSNLFIDSIRTEARGADTAVICTMAPPPVPGASQYASALQIEQKYLDDLDRNEVLLRLTFHSPVG